MSVRNSLEGGTAPPSLARSDVPKSEESTMKPMSKQEQPEKSAVKPEQAGPEYPTPFRRAIVMSAMYLALFLVILDLNIISTAIPQITDEFHSLNNVGWYGSTYILTNCSFQLLIGKVYKFYPVKPVLIVGIVVFEIGSALCGAAPNSIAFIIGRAIAGAGCSSLFPAVMVVMYNCIPLAERAAWQGGIGGVLALGSVIGPLLGGAFTDHVTWRWCFYINLPIGAVVVPIILFMLKIPNQQLAPVAEGWIGKFKQFDPIGNLCFFPGIVCLILALQWGGTTYAWSDARIIILFILCGVLVIAFVGIQFWKKEEATVPPGLLKQRSIAGSTLFSFLNGGGMMAVTYYLPIWFQVVKNVSAVKSGIMLLPTALSVVLGTVSSGIIVSKFGHYVPFLLLSSVMMPIGAGLITTFTPTTDAGKWVGYQIILGLGWGMGVQQPLNVVQTMLPATDIGTGAALVNFARYVSSAIFLPVGENIFLNKLAGKLDNLPGVDAHDIVNSGATELRDHFKGQDLKTLITDYNSAIVDVWYLVTAILALTILGSILVEWRSMKSPVKAQQASAESKAEKGNIESKAQSEGRSIENKAGTGDEG